MTRATLRGRIQNNLNDATGIYFDSTFVNDSIQDTYDEVVLDTGCVEAVATVNFQSNLIYYDLYNGIIPDSNYFWRISRIFNSQTNRWLPCYDSRVFDKYRFDWEVATGTPWFAYVVNFQYLSFFPHYPLGATGSFDVLYKVGRDVLISDGQVLQVPDEFSRIVEVGVTGDLLESYQEFKKAADYLVDYEQLKKKLKEYVVQRSAPDKLWQLNDLDSILIP